MKKNNMSARYKNAFYLTHDNHLVAEVVTHILFFTVNIIIFALIRARVSIYEQKNPISISLVNDLIYLLNLTIYNLYLALSSLFYSNKFSYFISSALLFHNAVISTIILFFHNTQLRNTYWTLAILLMTSYGLEFLISMGIIYINIKENNYKIFRKLGADEDLNTSYKYRVVLNVLNQVDAYFILLMSARYYTVPADKYKTILLSPSIVIYVSIVQKFVVSVRINQENVRQRLLAILVTLTKIGWILFQCIEVKIIDTGIPKAAKTIRLIIYIDIFVLSCAMFYYLIRDMQYFDSGLKDSMGFKTKKLTPI